ncbi:MAG TPA: adenylate kinase [Vampirovibrionales bacterium]
MNSEIAKNLLLVGPPGAGKGTQAALLCEELSLERIDTGSLIRAAIKEGSPLGIQAKDYVSKGQLVPDELIIGLILDVLQQVKDKGSKFLLDGFPRNLVQAEALASALEEKDLLLDKVIAISVDEGKLVERITGRRICTNKACNAVYHTVFSPSKDGDLCEKCGSATYQRDDDKEELVTARLNTYNRETQPLLTYYQQKGILLNIDGNKAPSEVFKDIKAALK